LLLATLACVLTAARNEAAMRAPLAAPHGNKTPICPPAGGDGAQSNPSERRGKRPPRFTLLHVAFENGWEGWTPLDFTQNNVVYGHIQDLSEVPGSRGNSFSGGGGFTGLVEWTGRGSANACGQRGCMPGYENHANQIFFKGFMLPGGFPTMSFRYRSDSEPGYDVTRVIVSRAGCPVQQGNGAYKLPGTPADRDTIATFSGFAEGVQTLSLAAYAGQAVCIIFQSLADGANSDEDCGYQSRDGMWECDNLNVAGDLTTWDGGPNGWTFGRVAGVGSFAALRSLAGLPVADPCVADCGLAGTVVTFAEPGNPSFHPAGQDEAIVSPPIDLTTNPDYPAGTYAVTFDIYEELPLTEGTFYYWKVRYSPVEKSDCTCLDSNDWSAWLDDGRVYYSDDPLCVHEREFEFSSKIPGHATRIQVALGVVNYPSYKQTSGGSPSPYFDNIAVDAIKRPAPAIVMAQWEYLQDAYPDAPTFAIAKSTPAKIDAGLNLSAPIVHTRLGDSATCTVALSCNPAQLVEVDYLFKVTPGPCLNTSHPWWTAYTMQPKIASGPYAGFAVARADTATAAGVTAASSRAGTFMSAFHESPPAAGTTYATFGNWSAYTGGVEGVRIFPDDLFTPGTHIEWVMHATYIPGTPSGDFYLPDPQFGNGDLDRLGDLLGNEKWASQGGTYTGTGPFVEELAVLPLTTRDGSPTSANCQAAQPAHCFLYVDAADQRGAQEAIENAFRNLQIGWDRYDVRAPASAMGNDLGSRYDSANYLPEDHAPGPRPSLLAEVYHAILWNTGTLDVSNFSDGATTPGSNAGNALALLDGWLRTGTSERFLWVSGTGNAAFLNRTSTRASFLHTTLGAVLVGTRYSDKNPSWGITITGVGTGCTAGLMYGLAGNWCPQRIAYSYLDRYTGPGLTGVNAVNFAYPNAGGSWYAAVENVATDSMMFRTQLDAWSLDQLRQSGVTMGHETNAEVTNWTAITLSKCFTGCFDSLYAVDVPRGEAGVPAVLVDAIANPARGGALRVRYTLAARAHVTLRVYAPTGRLVATLADATLDAGAHTAAWDVRGVPNGVYACELEAAGAHVVRKVVVVR
jgi:hypothetical protein